MPFYDYRCNDCEHAFTARRPIADRIRALCPQCSGFADMQFMPSGRFYISAHQSPHRRSSEEIAAGRHVHGRGFVEKHDPNEPYRREALADAEAQVRAGDAVRDAARTDFDRHVTYLDGPAKADARDTMERDLDRKGVRR